MSPTMAENPKPPTPIEIATPAQPTAPPPRRSRPRVREVSSRFMSPAISTPKPVPATPSETHHSKLQSLRRSQTDLRPRYADENRPGSINRSSVSPVRSSKPRSAVKLFKENPRTDTPAPIPIYGRIFRHRTWDTAATKLLQVSGIAATPECKDDHSNSNSGEDVSSIDGDCESVKSEPCETGRDRGGGGGRVSTPCTRSMELSHEQLMGVSGVMHTSKGGEERGLVRVKAARSLNLPPMPPMIGGAKGQAMAAEVKKVVRKGSSQGEDVHRLRMMYNHFVQWRFVNAKAQASMIAQKQQSERQLYALGVKISELQDSVKCKRMEYRFLKEMKTLSTILDTQVPYLDEWSTLEESYSSSLLELSQGLLNVLSQLPLGSNVRADINEIEDALQSATKAIEMICQQVQNFMPKAEQIDSLVSDLARVFSGEIALVDECGDLLTKTHISQVEECFLRGQLMQFHHKRG